ncbi:4-hydroxybutyrate CoA-transferase [Mycobacteroides stephanolepidis]|uniref:4-hydroxybutyrate CoA-transferase n=1 Tax=[Mycobacterium] stephanolepidis TaxID=1520670 RepID=A0A1Z4EYC5_9MYCO|nr:acetyl-CoA hydrolase/transferase C-terminal domain-containing protein [[Mycobacterium] stephanolepidis]BAX97954.1 4-hydroxybutyrate CoA-transferase [[Mycobacterium] stephanolepidis]
MNTPAPVAADDVLKFVRPQANILVPIGFGEPPTLIDVLEDHASHLDGVCIHQMDAFIERRYIRGEFGDHLRHVSYYLGPGTREAYWDGHVELVPNHFSEVPLLLRQTVKPDLVVAAANGPDEHGYFSLGTNADYVASFIDEVPFFLEVTDAQPFTYGQNHIHISKVAGWTKTDAPLPTVNRRHPDPRDRAIAQFIAERIPNGGCLQVGVGAIPDALLSELVDHTDLGVHTECFSDGLMNLVECGAVTGSRKRHHRNKHVATFSVGSAELMGWLHHNAAVEMLPVEWTNDPRVVAQEPNFISINATTEVDLMGQAASETIAGRYWSSSGGQADFARGAMYSSGGQAFLVLHSTTSSGLGRIRLHLHSGSVVTTLKNTIDNVVTEYGIATLRGASLSERARRLIAIAHPNHRDQLLFDARKAGLLH